ncbi:MAG: hypothetical protein HN411_01155 [Waddliaceae bacterium]|jgi:hypothetical protein|nr:hypothetical protein [Waddliaceae bacterium]MBT3579639.1 hypothetical protein [Waddliaceae bacterium]MBT4445224.1 hypothetical protein [Waddliaceae bacterium]MBT6928116.1 hypothetical protein [Waddliaceae bacterium]MBT7264677.1 hypothetical protein [Waddliaceae bacterium]
MGRGKLKNEFSWSFSRNNAFEECEKKYWYTYYGSWEGWVMYQKNGAMKADSLAGYLYAMKNMKNMPMFVGTVVHGTIEYALKEYRANNTLVTLEAMIEKGEEELVRGIEEAKNEKWRESPKKYNSLLEVYYADRDDVVEITEDTMKTAIDKMKRCITHWYNSPITQKMIMSPRSTFLGIEDLDSFIIDDVYKVWVVIDCALRWQREGKNDTIVLFDWKTGRHNEKDINQLYSYALFAEKSWGIEADRVVLVPYYLDSDNYDKTGAGQDKELSQEKIDSVEKFITMSSAMMEKKLHDTGEGREKNLKKNIADVMDFPYTNDRRSCSRCQYRELCEATEYEEIPHERIREAAAKLINLLPPEAR